MKIVIVEDEVRIREGIHRLLTKTDPSFEVVGEAENGREGVELLLRKRPDLALVDVRMPELDGIGMLEAVQAQGFKPMVIVLSAYSDFSYAQQAMKLGAREYLVKPIVVDELIGAVRRAKEALAQQTLARSGMRARGDVLSAALYANVPLSSEALEQVHRTFDLGENTPFALLMVHLADDTGFPAAERIAAFSQTHLGGECTILPQAMQGCIACVFTGFDGMLARTLEKKAALLLENGCALRGRAGFLHRAVRASQNGAPHALAHGIRAHPAGGQAGSSPGDRGAWAGSAQLSH